MCSPMIVTSYHAYVINVTLLHTIPDHNVYHDHRLTNGKTYIPYKVSFHTIKCFVQLCTVNQVLF